MESLIESRQFIAGEFVEGNSSDHLIVYDKFLGSRVAKIPLCSQIQLESAIEKALQAKKKYQRFSMEDRAALFMDLAKKLESQKEEFSKLIVMEAGKPIDYARVEVERSIENLNIAARGVANIQVPNVSLENGLETKLKRFPIGLVSGITPFNFPLNLALHKILPALAIGNPIILKPSPYTPLTLLAFCKLVQQTPLVSGMLNVVVANDDISEKLVTDERIKFFSFTGSAAVGWKLKSKAGKKKVCLELGGNAACIVDSSTDLSETVTKVCHGSFLYSGQICISTQRVYVENSIFDEFLSLMIDESEELVCGNPYLDGTVVGPIIDEQHLYRIHDWVQEAIAQGADLLLGGHILDEDKLLYAPTILTNTEPDMKVVSEEIFGPVVCIERIDDFDEALEFVNDSDFGLQAGVFTTDIEKAKKAFMSLEVGAVIINNVPGFRADQMPYGGVKDSGLGREGFSFALEEMSELRMMVF